MLWLAARLSPCDSSERKLVVMAATECASLVLPFFEINRPVDARPRIAIDACRAYARSEITLDELQSHADSISACVEQSLDSAVGIIYAADAARQALMIAQTDYHYRYSPRTRNTEMLRAAIAASTLVTDVAGVAECVGEKPDSSIEIEILGLCADIVRGIIPVMPSREKEK